MTDREPNEVRSSRFGLFAFIVVMALAITALTFVLLRPRSPSAASLALDRKIAQLRKSGAPLTAADMGAAFPDPDTEHDARLILQSAFAWSPGSRPSTNTPIVGGGSFPERDQPMQSEAMNELAMYLTNSDVMVSAIPMHLAGVRFSMGWSNGVTRLLPGPYVQVRRLAQAMALKSLYEAERQESQKAADTLSTGFRAAGTLNDEILVSLMMRVAVLGSMCEATERVLNRSKLTDGQLLSIQQNIDPALADNFTNAYVAERYISVITLDPIRAVYDKGGQQKAKLTLRSWLGWIRGDRKPVYRDEDYLLHLNILDERRAAQSLTGLARLQRSEQLDVEYKSNSFSATADLMGAHWTKAMRAAIETRAKLEAARTALALERYRVAHGGALPDSLSVLAPIYLQIAPHDPLDNQPLRFKKRPRGYIVYSIGSDGVDNGGAERANSRASTNYDVTFTVER